MPDNMLQALNGLNVCFTILFALEAVIKIVGLGPRCWWFDKFNVFDAIIVVVSLIELAIPGDTAAGALLAFRALRVLRVLRLLHRIGSLRVLLASIISSFEPVFFLILILILFLFMFGVLGVQLFAGDVAGLKTTDYLLLSRPWRFDNLWYSMITMLQIFSGDGWPRVMADAVQGTSSAAALVFVISVTIGVFVFKNFFLAILINRMNSQDNIQLMIDDLLNLAREKQRAFAEKIAMKEFEKDVKRIRKARLGKKSFASHQEKMRKLKAQELMTGTSLKFFTPESVIRTYVHILVNNVIFEMVINGFIITNCVFLAISGPHVSHSSDLGNALSILDWLFTVVFFAEMCLKFIAYGVYESPITCYGRLMCPVDSNYGEDGVPKIAADGDGDGDGYEEEKKDDNYGNKDNLGYEEDAIGAIGNISTDGLTINVKAKARKKPLNIGAMTPGSKKLRLEAMTAKQRGRLPCMSAYLNSWWDRIDCLVVIFAILGLIFTQVAFLRALRAIRPIRVAIRIKQVRVVVLALVHSMSNVLNAIIFSFFILFVFGIVGLHFFSGQFGRCVRNGTSYDLVTAGINSKSDCDADPSLTWIVPGYNFDNIGNSLLTVFKISMFAGWFEELASGMASRGDHQSADPLNAAPFNRDYAAVFFAAVVLVAGFFVLNIIISVVVDSFNRIKKEEEANVLLTQKQLIWLRTRRYLQRFPLKMDKKPPKQPWRLNFYRFVEQTYFEFFIIFCILLNTIFLMTEYHGQPQGYADALSYIEYIFLAIYVVEAALKLIGWGVKQYFFDWWNIFDFVIVVLSVIGASVEAIGPVAAVVRLLRVARLIRLVKRAPLLRALFLSLAYALPSMLNIGSLLMVIFFIYGIFGVVLFGKVMHTDGNGNLTTFDSNVGISNSVNFEYFGNALLVLYRASTNDNWGSILMAAGAEGVNCPDLGKVLAPDGTFTYECGSMAGSVIYFVSFALFGTFVMINLFVAVILDTYIDNVEFETKMEKLNLLTEWIAIWKELDENHNAVLEYPDGSDATGADIGGVRKLKGGDEEKEDASNNALKPIRVPRLRGRLPVKLFLETLRKSPELVGLILDALNLRLNIEETDIEVDYTDTVELIRRSSEAYGKLDFVGRPNPADEQVKVTPDHLNAIMKTRRLRILCRYQDRGGFQEILVIVYSEALFAIASLVVGPESRLKPWNNNSRVHLSDWWAEQLDENVALFAD
jgi:hypothetical protein